MVGGTSMAAPIPRYPSRRQRCGGPRLFLAGHRHPVAGRVTRHITRRITLRPLARLTGGAGEADAVAEGHRHRLAHLQGDLIALHHAEIRPATVRADGELDRLARG